MVRVQSGFAGENILPARLVTPVTPVGQIYVVAGSPPHRPTSKRTSKLTLKRPAHGIAVGGYTQ